MGQKSPEVVKFPFCIRLLQVEEDPNHRTTPLLPGSQLNLTTPPTTQTTATTLQRAIHGTQTSLITTTPQPTLPTPTTHQTTITRQSHIHGTPTNLITYTTTRQPTLPITTIHHGPGPQPLHPPTTQLATNGTTGITLQLLHHGTLTAQNHHGMYNEGVDGGSPIPHNTLNFQ